MIATPPRSGSRIIASENNQYVFIRGESFLKSADGSLMPTRKDQPPPDLRLFDQPRK